MTLQRAFARADVVESRELRNALKDAAEPVRSQAEALAVTGITRMTTLPWSHMRTGVTQKEVYVTVRERGVKSRGRNSFRRPKFKYLMRQRALQPALDRNIGQAERRIEAMLGTVARTWETH